MLTIMQSALQAFGMTLESSCLLQGNWLLNLTTILAIKWAVDNERKNNNKQNGLSIRNEIKKFLKNKIKFMAR